MDFKKLDKSQRKLIVALDLGTTFSGLAWAETRDPTKVSCITTWPTSDSIREGESSEKCPTKLRYSSNGREWGFAISLSASDNEKIAWFKLDIDDKTVIAYRSNSNDAARGGRTPDQLVADYLDSLSSHLLYMLRKQLGDTVIQNTPIEWVITVPAIWSDSAKDKTRPEAAALYTLHRMDPHGLAVNDTIVTVDAGGGTVDLITYTIRELRPIMKVDETAPGDGGLCGSNFLNERFKIVFEAKLGHLSGFDEDTMSDAMDTFETKIKRRFTTSTEAETKFMIPVGGLENNVALGIKGGRYCLTGAEVHDIFEPVVANIIDLVLKQINGANGKIKAVLLVGGFGASVYLWERLREAIDNDIMILQPPDAWSAVVRGAVLKGLAINSPETSAVSVRTRKARKSYGMELDVWYDDKEHYHLKSTRFLSHRDGDYKVRVMHWFVKRGEAVTESKPIPIDFKAYRAVSRGHPSHLNQSIFCDYAERDLLSPNTKVLQRDHRMRLLGELQADISEIPDDEHEQEMGTDLEDYYVYPCEVRARFLSASTEYTLWYDGEKRGIVNLEYA